MAEQPIRLTEKDLQRLSADVVPYFSPTAQAKFLRHDSTYKNRQTEVEKIRGQRPERLAEDKKSLIGSQVIASTAYSLLDKASALITIDPNNLYRTGMGKIIWGHIQVALEEKKDHLPACIRTITKRWARPIHPLLEELLLANMAAFEWFGQNQAQYQKRAEQVDLALKRETDQPLKNLAQARRRLVIFCDNTAADSEELAKTYIKLMPERISAVAQAFAQKHVFSDEQLRQFPAFINETTDLAQSKRLFARFLNQAGIPTADEMANLDKEAKDLWQNWIASKMEKSLTQITPKA